MDTGCVQPIETHVTLWKKVVEEAYLEFDEEFIKIKEMIFFSVLLVVSEVEKKSLGRTRDHRYAEKNLQFSRRSKKSEED